MQRLTIFLAQLSSSTEGYILEPREMWYSSWVVYAIVLAVGLVGFVRVLSQDLISGVFACLFVRPTSSTNFRETMSLLGNTFWIMLLNYGLISMVFIYLLLQLTSASQPMYVVFLPLFLFFQPILSLFLTSLFTGEYRRLKENIQIVSMTFQLIGLVLIPLTIILMLNPTYFIPILYAGVAIYALFTLVRLFRGASYALQNKIPWYYIILYLCSLEILPLGILYQLTV